jgi:signal transduction histidine kinase
MMNRFLIFFIFTLSISLCSGQTPKIDSLKQIVRAAQNPSAKLDAILNMYPDYQSMAPDTLWDYAIQATQLSKALKDEKRRGRATIMLARAYLKFNNIDSVQALIKPELIKYKVQDANTRSIYFQLKQLKIESIGDDNDYKNAMAAVYDILKEAEEYKDTLVMVQNMNILGVMYYDMDFVPEGRAWLLKGLALTPVQPRFYQSITSLCVNLADNYRWIGKLDSAVYYLNKGIYLSKQTQNIYLQSQGLEVFTSIHNAKKEFKDAEKSILESIRLIKMIYGDETQQDRLLILASTYRRSNQIDKAIEVLKGGLLADSLHKKISPHAGKSSSNVNLQKVFYLQELARCYKLKNDSKDYEDCLEKVIEEKDSFYKDNSAQAIAEYQTKYEVQKKEATIAQQRLSLIQENYFIYISILLVVLGGIISWLLFRDYRRKQKIALEKLREEEKRMSIEAVGMAKETERKRIAADLHDNLGAQLSYIKRNVSFIIDQPSGFGPEDHKKYLNVVNDTAQNAMIDLRETIWVMNKDEVNIQEFVDKLKSYLRQQLLGKDSIKLQFEEKVEASWKFSSGQAMHIFRIVQEAISNVIKHASATQIIIQFESKREGTYTLTISDNGKGFDTQGKYDGHYGLENIQQRASEINATLSIESNTTNGTFIILSKE